VDIFEVGGLLSKECQPAPPAVTIIPGAISWEICVENTGDLDLACDISDTKAFTGTKPLSVGAGLSACLPVESRPSTLDDSPSVTNEATATCTPVDAAGALLVDNTFDLEPATATCLVEPPGEFFCRTPGFWKTHAGTEKDGRSTNLTQTVIDSTPGQTLGTICGVEIFDTSVYQYDGPGSYPGDGANSAVEGMCVHPKTKIVRQLQRQLIAASVNCVVSGGGADCQGVPVHQDWLDANTDCTTVANGGSADLSTHIETIDDFNNGLYVPCSENIKEAPVFDGIDKVPGPAGSSNACSEATYNDFYLVPLP